MKSKLRGYRFCLFKGFFDKGYGLLSFPKYILVLLGAGEVLRTRGENPEFIVLAGFCFGLLCILIGAIWYKTGLVLSEAEVGNRFNLFQREMREKIGTTKTEKFK